MGGSFLVDSGHQIAARTLDDPSSCAGLLLGYPYQASVVRSQVGESIPVEEPEAASDSGLGLGTCRPSDEVEDPYQDDHMDW